jgi:acetoin utilization protein AcuB
MPHDAGHIRDGIAEYEKSYAHRAYHQMEEGVPERQPAIIAKQIFKAPVVSLSPTASIAEAWEVFCARRFRHIPVLNVSGRIVGIISDRDVLREAGSAFLSSPADLAPSVTQVQHVMTTQVLTAHPDVPIREIARVFFEERIGAVPIVDGSEELVGIVTRSDILRTIVNSPPLELWL